MKAIVRAFTPNKNLDSKSNLTVLLIWIIGTFLIWTTSEHKLIPTPFEILVAAKSLFFEKGFLEDLTISTWLCIKAMLYAISISFMFAILSVLPFFRPLSAFVAKSRFLTTVGLTFLFAQVTPDTSAQKMALLIFGITVFLVTSFLSVILEVKKDELDYARTLKMNEWESVWQVIVLGKADQFLEMIRHNFAMAWMLLAMVENLCRADGGIGVVISDQNKHFNMDAVYAIQITILLMGIFLDWALGFVKKIFCPYSELTLERK